MRYWPDLGRFYDKLRGHYALATWALIGVASAYAIAVRFYFAWDLPLWLDEGWTAVLSAAPTFRSFLRQMWLDSNAPAYYALMWLWPFESNFGLKLPSLIFMLLSCAIAIVWRPAQITQRQALFWAALMLLWLPGVSHFLDARYYALLFLASTVQTIAFLRLITNRSLGTASAWTAAVTLAILTHYYAALPAIFQGLYYLWRFRGRAVATWPAALLTLPAFAWLAYHWPRLVVYAQPESSWYVRLDPWVAAELVFWPFGGVLIGVGVLAIVILFRARIPQPILAVSAIAAATGLAFLVIGLALPVFVPRYLIPIAPPLLLGLAVAVREVGYLPLAAWMFLPISAFGEWSRQFQDRSNFGLEQPGASLEARNVTWMIDYPGSKIHDRQQMEAILVDAFSRNGNRLESARWGTDFAAGDGLLLIYPHGQQRPITPAGWQCASYSGWGHTTLACTDPRRRTGA